MNESVVIIFAENEDREFLNAMKVKASGLFPGAKQVWRNPAFYKIGEDFEPANAVVCRKRDGRVILDYTERGIEVVVGDEEEHVPHNTEPPEPVGQGEQEPSHLDSDDLLAMTIRELEVALPKVTDKEVLQEALVLDDRASAKVLIKKRIEELGK
jgi:hypothetical protein